jgi:O-antigen ligase
MIIKGNLTDKLSTFNFVLFFVGFDLFTSLCSIFIPDIAEVSQSVTIPYRAFSLGVALIVIVFTFKKKIDYNLGVSLLFLYLTLLIIRFFYDFEIRTDVFVESEKKMQLLMLFVQMVIMTIAISKSYRNIDLSKSFKWIYFCYSIIIIVNYFTVQEFSFYSNDIEQQVSSGVRNTIDTGYNAVNYLLFSIFFFKSTDFPKRLKIISLPVLFCAIIILLRAGSRGPLLALIIAIIFILVLPKKNYVIVLSICTLFIFGFFFFFNDILELISKISPVMTNRIQYTIEEGDNMRIGFFMEGINEFLNHPFTGSQALLYRQNGMPTYPHQLIIEAFMSTGIIGGAAILGVFYLVIKNTIFSLHNSVSNYWLELILIVYLTRAMTAGSIFVSTYPILFVYFFLARSKKSLFTETD